MRKVAENVLAFVVLAMIIAGLVFLMPEILIAVTAVVVYVVELFVIVYLVNAIFDGVEVVL